ncbi:MAG: hypothetical protein V1913_14270 [Fibrobacterota bacterium]
MWNKIKAFASDRLYPIFFVPREVASKGTRLFFLDGFRSVALLLMVASHGLKTWIHPAFETPVSIYFKLLINKIPAPMFFFLVGASYVLSRDARLRRGMTRQQVLFSFARRSLVLFALAFVYKLMDALFGVPLRYIRWWEIDVLNIIALSLFLIAWLDYATRTLKNSHRLHLIAALVGVTLTPLLFKIHFPAGFPNLLRLYIQGTQAECAWFTLLPYACYTFFGAWMVQGFVNGTIQKPFLNLHLVSLLLLSCMGLGQLLPRLAPDPWIRECGLSLFYFSRAFLLLSLGVYGAHLFQRFVGFGPFLIIGAYTMLGYWVHAKVVYLYYKPHIGAETWAGSFLLLLKVYAMTFAAVFAWSEFKKWRKRKKKAAAAMAVGS